MKEFSQLHPSVSISPVFSVEKSIELFLKRETDITLALAEQVRRIPDIQIHPFYESPICLISKPDDPLAQKEFVTADDLTGRTLMVGSGSPLALRRVQQRVISTVGINYFNSSDHDLSVFKSSCEIV